MGLLRDIFGFDLKNKSVLIKENMAAPEVYIEWSTPNEGCSKCGHGATDYPLPQGEVAIPKWVWNCLVEKIKEIEIDIRAKSYRGFDEEGINENN